MRSAADIRAMLAAGADKISLNSAAVRDPELITRHRAASTAASASSSRSTRSRSPAAATAGRSSSTAGASTPGIDAVEWAREVERLGAGEILLTSMDRDGTNDGYDIPLTRAVTRAVNIPVIASGGAGELDHFAEVVIEADADAVLAASDAPLRQVHGAPGQGAHGGPRRYR